MKRTRMPGQATRVVALAAVLGAALVAPAGATSIFNYAVFGKTAVNLGPDCKVINGLIGSNGVITVGNGSTDGLGITGGATIGTGSNNHVYGSVLSSGDTSLGGGTSVQGDIDVGGALSTGSNAKIYGNVAASGSVSLGGGSHVEGNVASGGDLTLLKTSKVMGDASVGTATSTVTMFGSSRVEGTLTLPGGAGSPFLSKHATASVGAYADGFLVPTVQPYVGPTLPTPGDITGLVSLGDLTVSAYGTYGFAPGTYLLDSLTLADHAQIDISGATTVYVLGDVSLDKFSGMNLLGGALATDPWFETFGNWTGGDGSNWYGVVYASNPAYGDITWRKNSKDVNASLWAAGTITTANHVYMTRPDMTQPTQDPIPEPVTCAGLAMGLAGLVGYLRRRR